MDLMRLNETLDEVKTIAGVVYVGYIHKDPPKFFENERLLAIQGQYTQARVMDVSDPELYACAYQYYCDGMAPETYILKVEEKSVDEALKILAKNSRISFLIPNK